MDELPQILLFKFRHDPSDIWMITQCFDPFENFRDQPVPDVGDTLFRIPAPELFEIRNR